MASPRFACHDGFSLAARLRDRRRDGRLRITRLVKVAHDGDAAYARCRDLSDTGMQLDLSAPLELNERVTVALSPSIALCGTVVWVNGRECGVAFDCPVDSEALLDAASARPPEQRLPAMLDLLDIRQPPVPAGDAPTTRRAFSPGLAVTVMVGPDREQRGMVRWAKDNIAALELAEPGECVSLPKLLPAPSSH